MKNLNMYYKKKRYITTKSEVELYKILVEIANNHNMLVLSQVVLYELIEVNLNKQNRNYLKYFNKIQSKSIDFVIIDKETTRILHCIELDDYTHNTPKRIERDLFVNELFRDLQMPLLRIKVNSKYNKEKIEKIILENCKSEFYKVE